MPLVVLRRGKGQRMEHRWFCVNIRKHLSRGLGAMAPRGAFQTYSFSDFVFLRLLKRDKFVQGVCLYLITHCLYHQKGKTDAFLLLYHLQFKY